MKGISIRIEFIGGRVPGLDFQRQTLHVALEVLLREIPVICEGSYEGVFMDHGSLQN